MPELNGEEQQKTRWLDQLKAHGYRMTRPRQAVVEAILGDPTHWRPEQVFERARRTYPNLGLVTVYRTLELLQKLGLIRRVHMERGCRSYTLASQEHSHQLICRDCGRVEEFSECDLLETVERLAKRTGYSIEAHWLELLGRCPACLVAG
ncbi:MAG: hypothetical protein A2Z21_05590 [Candidatus Fraserbacteria bacterium RBG_16_55_9]|uniref:Transcriptional repressor n=1 Tax=Fraserbacteria sp. (strain RBG_16_55_9) TaxID=1817864 RepID=A0A1F5UPJ2_FRAXR|nr:MAG: hypothetical protein A2Z21_05590 [Candidatus Fraserbacteria bacterium RBG_16_55_9]